MPSPPHDGLSEYDQDHNSSNSLNMYNEDQTSFSSPLVYSSDDSVSDAYFSRTSEPRRMNSLCYSPDSTSRKSTTPGSNNNNNSSYSNYGALDPVIHEDELMDSAPLPRRISHGTPQSSSRQRARDARKAIQQQQRLMEQLQVEEDHYEDEQWVARHHHQQVILRGKIQPEKWNDVIWLVLFVAHLLIIVGCALSFGTHSVFVRGGGHVDMAPSKAPSSYAPAVGRESSHPVIVISSNSANGKKKRKRLPATDDDDALLSTFLEPTNLVLAATRSVPSSDFPHTMTIQPTAQAVPSSDAPSPAPPPGSRPPPISTIQPQTRRHHENYESFQIDYQTVMEVVSITGIYACILSSLTVGFMLIIGKSLIQTALIFTMVASLVWGLFGMAIQHTTLSDDDYITAADTGGSSSVIAILGFCALGLTVGYTLWVWDDSLPLSATHVHTALCGMRESSSDTLLMGMAMIVVAFGWCMLWSMAFIGIVDTVPADDYAGMTALYALLLLSLCWTNLVIKNIVQVSVASAVGTWWFEPDSIVPCCTWGAANDNPSFRKRAVWRCMTTSLGSICLGSLILLPVQFYQFFAFWLPERYRLRHVNRYAYTYIGLYGYSYMDAGRKARELFDMTGGWRLVADDYLVHLVLLMVCVGIAGSTGTFGVLVEEVDGYEFTTFHKPILTSFVVGSTIGFILSNILLLGVLDSSVNTVLVCFAASPREFHENHPRLSSEMREVWTTHIWRDRNHHHR